MKPDGSHWTEEQREAGAHLLRNGDFTIGRHNSFPSRTTVVIVLLIISRAICASAAIPAEECFNCHEAVKKNFFHGNLGCAECHGEITEIPHAGKLLRPRCITCHGQVNKRFSGSVHASKSLVCQSCHGVVHSAREKKDCNACHEAVAHKKLPSREKHLGTLDCLACHGKSNRSEIKVRLALADGAILDRGVIDRDGNNIVDATEWHSLDALLKQKYKGYRLEKKYWLDGSAHEVNRRAADCSECHEKRTRFPFAVMQVSNGATYVIRLAPEIFIPDFPSLAVFSKTVHGQKGVKCADCHVGRGQAKIGDAVCIRCHSQVYATYGKSIHAEKGATSCTDCHNPHRIRSYKELNAKERIAVCSRCHNDFLSRHEWLPNTSLHFDYLECTTCHSPGSEKSMVFFFSMSGPKGRQALKYEEMEKSYRDVTLESLAGSGGNAVNEEIGRLFLTLRERMGSDVFIDASIIVTKVHHDYSVTRSKDRECKTCHSPGAQFYKSMFFVLPQKEHRVYLPVKGTQLSALPIGMARDFYLLGEEKITRDELYSMFGRSSPGRPGETRSLGLKWIDVGGIGIFILILFGILVHALLRRIGHR
jgi:predicted CXXCH cytochrome family protein